MPECPISHTQTYLLNIESAGALERAVSMLQDGQPICFPTDTVYGIGVHAFQPAAVEGLYTIKGRPRDLPIPLLLPDAALLERTCIAVPPAAWRLAECFWPGGLSLVLRRSMAVPDVVTAGGATVAVRVPDHAWVRALCRQLGAPLAATSANLHGQPSPTSAEEVRDTMGGRVPLILDGGACRGGVASTVLDLTVTPPAILRPGPIRARQLAKVVRLRAD